jgi:hypothetical protein
MTKCRGEEPMRYNVAIVVVPPIPSDDKQAWQEIDALIDAEGEPPKVFRELHDHLTMLLTDSPSIRDCHFVSSATPRNFRRQERVGLAASAQ